MKIYNKNTDKIEVLPSTIVVENAVMLTSKMSQEDLIDNGYYPIEYESKPNRRYYMAKETKAIENGVYKIKYTPIPKDLDEVKNLLKKAIKERFIEKSTRSTMDTSLGFPVDVSMTDVLNLEMGKELNAPYIKDANGNLQEATDEIYTTVISEMKQFGLQQFNIKWTKESEVDALITVSDCELYENTPYEYIITEDDIGEEDFSLEVGDVVTRYKNNCKDW